jgi:5'-3' exonuclease
MGSAIGNLVGGVVGGGGGILGTVAGIAGTAIGGPVGGAIGSALGNALQGAAGNGVKSALTTLQQESGMPKFLADALTKVVDKVVDDLKNKDVPADAQHHVQEQHGDSLDRLASELADKIINAVKSERAEDSGKGGDSWMMAIAKAMGKAMGEKARSLVDLSDKISTTKAKGTSVEDKQDAADKVQNYNAQFQATSQEFNLMQTTFSTAIKAIGEGMASVARKQ